MAKKLEDNIYGQERHYLKEMLRDSPSYQHQCARTKRRKLKDLSIEEKIDVLSDAVILKDYHDNICQRYNIGRESLKTLLKNYKNDYAFLRKRNDKEVAKRENKEIIL